MRANFTAWGSFFCIVLLAEAARADEARGTISRIDPDRRQIVVVVSGRGVHRLPMTFDLDDNSQITAGNQAAKITDLRTGQRARISYEMHDGHRVAVGISVRGRLGDIDLGGLLGGALGGPSSGKSGEPPLASEPQDANAIRGVLQRVAITDREIVTVGPNSKGEGEIETTISVPPSASVTRDGQPIKFEDLKEGQSVTVHADSRNGRIVAKDVQLGRAPARPAATTARSDRIEKIRHFLKLVDALLEQQQSGDQAKP
jgi:hypothetical protein